MWNKFARNISQHTNAEAMSAISIPIYVIEILSICPIPWISHCRYVCMCKPRQTWPIWTKRLRLVLYNRAMICLFLVWSKLYGAITFCGLRKLLRGAVSGFRAPLRDPKRTGNLFYFYLWRRKLLSVLWQLLFYHFLKNALRYDVNLVSLLSLTLL